MTRISGFRTYKNSHTDNLPEKDNTVIVLNGAIFDFTKFYITGSALRTVTRVRMARHFTSLLAVELLGNLALRGRETGVATATVVILRAIRILVVVTTIAAQVVIRYTRKSSSGQSRRTCCCSGRRDLRSR